MSFFKLPPSRPKGHKDRNFPARSLCTGVLSPSPCPLHLHSGHPVPGLQELLRGSGSVLPARSALVADWRVPSNFRAGNFLAGQGAGHPLRLEKASGMGFLRGLRGANGTQGQPGRPGSPGSARERRREAWACVTRGLPAARTSCWGHRCCRAEPAVHFTTPGPQSR